MPASWSRHAAVTSTSASRPPIPWSETTFGTTPRRISNRRIRKAMLVTMRMWIHAWIHIRIVTNIALRILRLLMRRGVVPNVVSDHGMGGRDAEVLVTAACLLHDAGMSIHRTDHEAYSLFLAAAKLPELLADAYA